MPRSIVAVGVLATHRSNNSSTRPDVRLHYYPNQDFEENRNRGLAGPSAPDSRIVGKPSLTGLRKSCPSSVRNRRLLLLSKCNGRRCDSLCRSNTCFKDRVLFHFAQTPVPCEQKSAAD